MAFLAIRCHFEGNTVKKINISLTKPVLNKTDPLMSTPKTKQTVERWQQKETNGIKKAIGVC